MPPVREAPRLAAPREVLRRVLAVSHESGSQRVAVDKTGRFQGWHKGSEYAPISLSPARGGQLRFKGNPVGFAIKDVKFLGCWALCRMFYRDEYTDPHV